MRIRDYFYSDDIHPWSIYSITNYALRFQQLEKSYDTSLNAMMFIDVMVSEGEEKTATGATSDTEIDEDKIKGMVPLNTEVI